MDNSQGEWWLVIQLLLVLSHLIPPWPTFYYLNPSLLIVFRFLGSIIFLYGCFSAIRAFLELGPSLSPLPEPKVGAKLVTRGVYSQCRHPVYQALLICSIGLATFFLSFFHLALFFMLAFILRSKALREESKLKLIHSEYIQYMFRTPAIITFIPFLDWRK